MMPRFSSKEEFWNTPLKTRPGKTARALMDDGLGDPEYSFEDYVSGPYGDRITEYFRTYALYDGEDMHPDVLEYWRNYGRGLDKYFHDDEDLFRRWCAYVPCSAKLPENAGRKYPCFVIGQRTPTMMLYEASSFIHMAARNEIVVLTGNDVNEDDNFERMLDTALKLYPIDPSRVYLHGHSFGAVLSGRHAVKYAKRIAGVCMSGSQYYGADSTDGEIAYAAKARMPLIAIHCTNQSRNLLPYNVTPRRRMSPKNRMNATTSDFTLLTGYEELKFWRMINHCRSVGIEYMRNIQENSSDPCEQVLGIQFDDTHVEQREGVDHYFGDIYDDNGTVMLRYVAVKGGPHAVPPHAGDIAWEFLKDFSRDTETGALLRQGKAAGTNDPFWTEAFPAIGLRTPREYVGLEGDAKFDFGAFFTDAVTRDMKEALYTRLHFTGGEEALAGYWKARGIVREEREREGKKWVLYAPEGARGPLPAVLYLGDTPDVMDSEASGFAQAAVQAGMLAAMPSDPNDGELVDGVIAELASRGMLKDGYLFLAGFGFGAQCAGRHAVRLGAKALCLMGEQYYGYDNPPEEISSAMEKPLPVMMVHGTREARGILPLYEDSPLPLPGRRAEGVTMSTFSLISSYSEHMFWRQMNGIKDVELSQMACLRDSADECLRAIGAPADRTFTLSVDGVRVLAADVTGENGRAAIAMRALCGAPHAALPCAAKLACAFFREQL